MEKKAIYIEPFYGTIEDTARRMEIIKRETGKEVYTYFTSAALQTYLTTEMGNAEEIIQWFNEAAKAYKPLEKVDYIKDEKSEIYGSKEYYESIKNDEDKKIDEIKKGIKLRTSRVNGLIQDLIKCKSLIYDDTYCTVTIKATDGNLEETVFYKQDNPLNDKKKGTIDTSYGKEVAIELLENVDYYYSDYGENKENSELELNNKSAHNLYEYLTDLEVKIQKLAQEYFDKGFSFNNAIHETIESIKDDDSISELDGIEKAVYKPRTLNQEERKEFIKNRKERVLEIAEILANNQSVEFGEVKLYIENEEIKSIYKSERTKDDLYSKLNGTNGEKYEIVHKEEGEAAVLQMLQEDFSKDIDLEKNSIQNSPKEPLSEEDKKMIIDYIMQIEKIIEVSMEQKNWVFENVWSYIHNSMEYHTKLTPKEFIDEKYGTQIMPETFKEYKEKQRKLSREQENETIIDIENEIENEVESKEVETIDDSGNIEHIEQVAKNEETIGDIPSIPESNPNENELQEGITINEKGEIIREERQDQLSNTGKEEVTAIATRQKESKFKAFVNKIKMILSKNKEQDNERK